jgi:hypothetical protein
LQLGQAARVTQGHPEAPLPGHQTLNMSDRQLRQLKKTPMEDDIPEPEQFGHMPVHSTTKQVCWLCRWSWKCRGAPQSVPKTHWACEDCDMPLCLSGKRNCFKEMHEFKQVGAFSEGVRCCVGRIVGGILFSCVLYAGPFLVCSSPCSVALHAYVVF